MQVSVVVPVYNSLPLARKCLASVFDVPSDVGFEVIVVDNGSGPEVEEWLVQEQTLRPGLRCLRYSEPLGFARAVNAGGAAAAGEVLIILNSDTIVSPGWMKGLYLALTEDPSLGAITPCTNQAGEPAQMNVHTIDLPASKALAYMSRKPPIPDILYLPHRLTFFCVALRREVWNEFGGLGESYRVGNFEDDDLCLRLRLAGYRLAVARHLFVYHHSGATFRTNRIDRELWLSQNAAVFASRARCFAEAENPPPPRWPKRSCRDLSVVVQARDGASLDRTLRSLANQTVQDFEIILPGAQPSPASQFVAYVTQGDILYPFHLEALMDFLNRTGADAVFADAWNGGTNQLYPHPDASRTGSNPPLLLSGWLHRSFLDPDCLGQQPEPVHFPRPTWETDGKQSPKYRPFEPGRLKSAPPLVEAARRAYRRSVALETRHAIDARVRKLLGRFVQDPAQVQLSQLAAELDACTESRKFANRFEEPSSMPTVFLFNIVPWNGIVQRPHHFARGLAALDHRVFWVETGLSAPRNWWSGRPLQQIAPGIFLLRLPGPAAEIYHMPWSSPALDAMCAALRLVSSAYGIGQAVSLVHYPRWQPLAARLRDRCGWSLVYDCLDDQTAFSGLFETHLQKYEKQLVGGADLLFTSSAVLQQRMRRRRVTLLHNAADYNTFSSGKPDGYLDRFPCPVIGFFGALADWLDMDLIRASALRFPNWSFVYIGPLAFANASSQAEWLRCTNLPNIAVLPQLDPQTLAAYLAEFDVCTVPFRDLPVTRTMNPVKIYEYLAAGKPVISRDLPEVRHLVKAGEGAEELILLYRTPEEFFGCLQEAVQPAPAEITALRQSFARKNDWRHRVEVLSGEIVQLTQETSSMSPSSKGANARSQQ
jgi:GT2 family glycosyltransferase/glycosyltransferase involved in cell wall biosynthesis